jgi:hypothetical protein
MTLRDTFRPLLEAAQQFETKTAKYERIESERQGSHDPITDPQFILSVQEQAKSVLSCSIAGHLSQWLERHVGVVVIERIQRVVGPVLIDRVEGIVGSITIQRIRRVARVEFIDRVEGI